MLNGKPKSYPVVDASNKVVGVLSRRHILMMLDEKLQELVHS
jgi:predicted transcriptional regulator